MSIPPFQETMFPLLKALSTGQELGAKSVIETVSDAFKLSDDERKQMLPSGNQRVIANRCLWALSYMKKAQLIVSPKRGVYKIAERGIDALKSGITNIGIEYLSQYPEFQEFRNRKNDQQSDIEQDDVQPIQISEKTPEEILENAYQGIRRTLESDILEKVYSQTPDFFERLVIELLVKMGYGGSISEAGKAIGKSGDEGIDGVIKEDKLGLDIIYIQAKRWAYDNTVGRPEIQKFVGALAGQGAKKGIFITTSKFTKEALEYTPRNETKVVLIDGKRLAQLLIDNDIGVSPVIRYEIKRLDNDYFADE